MNKTRKLQDYAEDINSSQSDNMEEQPQGGSTFTEMLQAARLMTDAAETINKNSETIGLVANGIGRYLLNEDGTVRDFTNVKLMNEMVRLVNEGMATLNACAISIDERIKKMPTTFHHDLTEKAYEEIRRLNKNLRMERIIFVGAFVLVAIFAAFTAYKGFQIADKSGKLNQWYEENNEAILFGRYLRLHDNDRWKWWHDKWVSDPGLKEDMSDYFMMEEWKESKKK